MSRGAGLGELLEGRRICICVGAGGVGKTTTAAAIGLELARRGQKVALVTIDPARRLAGALGLDELGNEPRLVDRVRLSRGGVECEGELWAMMLDPKRTFDDLIGRLAPDERARDEVLGNRIYRELSSAVAGSQEFTAIAKLYELDREAEYDAIVLDTPPSRNALDFIQAPADLTQFFEGRALRALLAPTSLASRLVGRSTGLMFGVLGRLTGVDLLGEVGGFFRALSGMLDGFAARAQGVAELLRDPATGVILVSTAERRPIDESIAFARELDRAGMRLTGVVVNRMHLDPGEASDPEAVRADLVGRLGERLAGRVAENLRDFQVLAGRDRAGAERLERELGGPPMVYVPGVGDEVGEIAGLARVGSCLFGAVSADSG
ncbi:MAG TPA: ArsA-related P-loop ATPase [Solirubrobacteraceae bacterium]|nr:ArsA-related P-loop ATPase [Solirubrobacteraceae bacterium]